MNFVWHTRLEHKKNGGDTKYLESENKLDIIFLIFCIKAMCVQKVKV